VSPRLLSVAAVADSLSVSRDTVYRLIASGQLPAVDVGTGRAKTRIRETDLNVWVDGRTVKRGAA
jgi:excisionase family DNA binding protein